MAEHWTSGWYCLGCKRPRAVEDFGSPCPCGAYPIACDERHGFTPGEMKELADRVRAEAEDQDQRGSDQGQHDILEGQVHGSTSTPEVGR